MAFGNIQLDYVNLKIIETLSKNSSTSFVEIAKEIGISDATVHMRVKRLIYHGIINKFTISVNHELMGYNILAFLGMNIKGIKQDEIIVMLKEINEILEIHEIYGKYDLFLKIRTKNNEELRNLVKKIKENPNVVEIEVINVLKTNKEDNNISFRGEINKMAKEEL